MAANSAFQFLKILVILQRRIRPRFFVSEMLFREKNYPLRMPELYPSPDGSILSSKASKKQGKFCCRKIVIKWCGWSMY